MYYYTFTIFIILSVVYYYLPIQNIENFGVLLTISTFLFSIFTGFFIQRQGNRYSLIRDRITEFDGNLSSIYRLIGHFGKEVQNKTEKIIKAYYERIIKNNDWSYNFTHKSNTITSIHFLLDEIAGEKSLPSLKNASLTRILSALRILQQTRKKMIALYHERIPKFQWILLGFLAIVLFSTLSVIPSHLMIFNSILKGVFASSIVFVFILLSKFDRLKFFDKSIGEDSAKDVLDIFEGKK